MFKKIVEDFRDQLADVHQDHLPGGQADGGDPHDYDPHELLMGIAHEMEHTHDIDIAAEIAMDHLEENPAYYSELASSGIDPSDAEGGEDDGSGEPEDDEAMGGY